MDMDNLAAERVRMVRAELITSHAFYGVLVSNVEPIMSKNFPTACTDGAHHYWNPDYVASKTQRQLLVVQRHESEHDARHHHTRRGTRDPKKWNEACDYSINIDLWDEGYSKELTELNALVDPRFRGMSAEDIYRIRELDEQKQQAQQPPKPEESDEDEEDEGSPTPSEDDDEADDSEDADDGGKESDEEGDESSDTDGDEPSEDDEDGDGEGGDEDGEPSDEDAEAKAAKQSSGDPGGMGEVVDGFDSPAEAAVEDAKWETIVREAASLAKSRGELPGHVSREIARSGAPKEDWRETLRAYFDLGAQKRETYSRRNRRFQHVIMPGAEREGLNKVYFLVDTSGSMDAIALQCISTEAQAALDENIIDELVVVYGDTRVTRVDSYQSGDVIEFDPRGGGGTDLRPLFQYTEEQGDAALIVCFTDLYIGDAGPQPSCPVLFAVTGYPQYVRELIANAPWSSPGIDVGAH